ncbi:MAG: hypothetical protein KJ915_02045 [Candidatus Omnitrophica bacterium]|nr:hypothetical protein [Candidatus Omnitrophota bacterium]
MKKIWIALVTTASGYFTAPFIVSLLKLEPYFDLKYYTFESIPYILFASPYCMVRYLMVSYKFFPKWYSITTIIGATIWGAAIIIYFTTKIPNWMKVIFLFLGAFIWNLGFVEASRYFLTA